MSRTKSNLLQLYRLSAYYAANPSATPAEGAKAVGFKSSGCRHYYNCVHLRDPKGVLAYSSMEGEIPPEDYAAICTRIPHDVQRSMIAAFKDGGTVDRVAKRFNVHPQHVMVFSLVYRTYCGGTVNQGRGKWVPYSRHQYKVMADQLQKYDQPQSCAAAHGVHRLQKVHEYLQPELNQAIREMFLTKKRTPFTPASPPMPDTQSVRKKEKDTSEDCRTVEKLIAFLTPSNGVKKDTADIFRQLNRIEEMLKCYSRPAVPAAEHFSHVENTFALDVMPPQDVHRWLSPAAIQLFPKLVRGEIHITRDEDEALFELENFGFVEIPKIPSADLMGSVTVCRDMLKITDKGWSLHRLIRDIVEKVVYCCLEDMGAMMGFNISVGENSDDE